MDGRYLKLSAQHGKGCVSNILQQNGDCYAGPYNAKERYKEGIVGFVSEILASDSRAQKCGILNASLIQNHIFAPPRVFA